MGLWKDLISEGEINGTTRPYYHHDHHHHHYHQTGGSRLSHKSITEQTTPSTLQPLHPPNIPSTRPYPLLSPTLAAPHAHPLKHSQDSVFPAFSISDNVDDTAVFADNGFLSSPYPTPASSPTPHLD